MDEKNEKLCMEKLQQLLESEFDQLTFCLNGPKESAVCLEKKADRYVVFENERNNRSNEAEYDNLMDAAMDLIHRLSDSKEEALTVQEKYRETARNIFTSSGV